MTYCSTFHRIQHTIGYHSDANPCSRPALKDKYIYINLFLSGKRLEININLQCQKDMSQKINLRPLMNLGNSATTQSLSGQILR